MLVQRENKWQYGGMGFLRYMVLPVVLGFAMASLVMSVSESISSLFFPLPHGLNWSDPRAVHAATAALSWGAHVLTLLGWGAGAYVGGAVAKYLSVLYMRRVVVALSALLMFFGALNIILLGQPEVLALLGLPLFALGTFLGYRYPWQVRRFMKKLPAHTRPVVLPLILTMFMTAIVSAIATIHAAGFDGLAHLWLGSWLFSWAVAFPTLTLILPVIQKSLRYIVED